METFKFVAVDSNDLTASCFHSQGCHVLIRFRMSVRY